ncbi:MAG: transposase [Lachnospiraceae bacterium]|nr:transposase [Lachnospiraceae bacterium]MDY4118633.1 transposase [Lachnospiraceae bacterium]
MQLTIDAHYYNKLDIEGFSRMMKDPSYYHRHKFDMEYDAIIKTAYEENPLPETPAKKCGRKKKSKVLNLICRLGNYKESVCLFIKNLCVPFDSNQAERDLRMVKVKTKVSGCI